MTAVPHVLFGVWRESRCCGLRLIFACAIAWTGLAQEPQPTPPTTNAVDEQYRLAIGMYRRNMYDMASEVFRKLLDKHPDFKEAPRCHFLLAYCRQQEKDDAGALAAYQELRQKFPKDPFAYRALENMAPMLLAAGRHDEVLSLLKAAHAAPTKEAEVAEAIRYFLAITLGKVKQTAAASEHFAALASLPFSEASPYRAHAALHLGFLHQNNGKSAEAAALFTRLANGSDVSAEVAADALFQLGELAFTQADYDKAAAHYGEVSKRFPKGKHGVRARLNQAWALYQLRRFQDALAIVNADAGAAPLAETGELLYLRASCRKLLKLYEPALAEFTAITKRFANSEYAANAAFEGIECLYALSRYEDCIAAVNDFLKAQPTHPYTADAYYFLAQSHAARKQLAPAAEAFEHALRTFWGKWEFQEDAVLILADIYLKMKKPSKAAATLRRLLELKDSQRHSVALLTAAEYELQAGNLAAAAKDYERVAKAYPDSREHPLAVLKLAELRLHENDNPAALAALDQFISTFAQHPLQARALYLRGTIRYRDDDLELAIQDLRASLKSSDFGDRSFARLVLAHCLWQASEESNNMVQQREALSIFSKLLADSKMRNELAPSFVKTIADRYLELNNLDTAASCYELLDQHPDVRVRVTGLIGRGRLAMAKKDWNAAREALYKARDQTGEQDALRAEALSFLGEALWQMDKLDEALLVLNHGLKVAAADASAKARIRLGLARVYHKRGDRKQALSYAYSVFVLYSHPRLTPAAMLLAMTVLHEDGKRKQAADVLRELEKRYPAVVANYRSRPVHKQLFADIDAVKAE